MCHDSFVSVLRLIHERETTHSYVPWLIHMCHDSFICAMTHAYVPWLIRERVETHPWAWDNSFICAMTHLYVSRLIHECDMPQSYVPRTIHMWYDLFTCDIAHSWAWHDSFTRIINHSYVTWPIYMWHDSFMSVTRLIHTWHDLFICDMTWLIHTWQDLIICDMTHSYVTWSHHMWHDSFMSVTRLIYVTYEWVISHMNESCHTWIMWHGVTLSNVCHDWFMSVTWLIHEHDETHLCHVWMSHITYELVISHVMSHVTHELWDMMSRSVICATTGSWVWHDSSICAMNHWYESRDMMSRSKRLIVGRDMTHSYVLSLIHTVTWPIHMWHDSFTSTTRLIVERRDSRMSHVTKNVCDDFAYEYIMSRMKNENGHAHFLWHESFTRLIWSANLSFLQSILELGLSQIFSLKSTDIWRSRIRALSVSNLHLQF